MKLFSLKKPSVVSDPTAAAMLRALRRARTSAARSARLHKLPLVYLEGRKLVRDRFCHLRCESGDLIEIDAVKNTMSLLIPE
ncbi:MAG: hypothetical protein WCG63_11175, partial [Opitutaceae bacterium]